MGERNIVSVVKEIGKKKIEWQVEEILEEKIEEIKKIENYSSGKYVSKDSEEFERKYIEEMLIGYIEECNNYVVDNAIITCDQMSNENVYIGYEGKKVYLRGEAGEVEKESEKEIMIPYEYFFEYPFDEEIRKLRAVHALNQTANGLTYATVTDRGIQRRKDEGKLENASIISLGNCKLLMESDIEEIEKRGKKAGQYGTCYCLMKLVEEWNNPMCMEVFAGNQDTIEFHIDKSREIMSGINMHEKPQCVEITHHQTMKWDTKLGKKEGLTMLSTLLCTRGGVISIVTSGQTKIDSNIEDDKSNDIEYRIQILMSSVEGNIVYSAEELKNLSTIEILSRLIYQEARGADDTGKNAVAFSIINRLFSDKIFLKGTKSNNLYSYITGKNQYQSISDDGKKYPNAFRPPISEDSNEEEKHSWENAKRIAAILIIAIEDYGEVNESVKGNDRAENVIIEKDKYLYNEIVDFMEQQNDINGIKIKNDIETRESFVSTSSYTGSGRGGIDICGNTFFWDE